MKRSSILLTFILVFSSLFFLGCSTTPQLEPEIQPAVQADLETGMTAFRLGLQTALRTPGISAESVSRYAPLFASRAAGSVFGKLSKTEIEKATLYFTKAYQHLLPLAADGDLEAQVAVGLIEYSGLGTEQNVARARERFQEASSSGSQTAARVLQRIDRAKRPMAQLGR